MPGDTININYSTVHTVQRKTLMGENIDEFSKSLTNHQSFFPQMHLIFNIHLPLLGHSPNFSPPNSLIRQCFPLYIIYIQYSSWGYNFHDHKLFASEKSYCG